jgi:acyl-ACP thioesterase
MTDLPDRPALGRLFAHSRLVRLSDAGPDGVLRLDGVARYLQDAASDDWIASGVDPDRTWVVRRTTVRLTEGGRWPALGERVAITTWCSGTGPACAERRSDIEVDGTVLVEAAALWVPLDRSGRPGRLGPAFHATYGAAAQGRRVSGRVRPALVSPDATRRPWPIRRADLDVAGHVNNAAVWAAVTEVTTGGVETASVYHHGPLSAGTTVHMLTAPGRIWLVTGEEVSVSAAFTPA